MSGAIEPLVVCRGVTRIYGEGSARMTALAGIDLEVSPGELLALVGPSGSGKSTLLHLIGAMDRPSTGVVRVGGEELARLADAEAARFRRLRVGFVFQFFNLVPTLSALDNVALPARLAGEATPAARARAAALLERVGLGDRLDGYPDTFSGGQQQRVAIARALVNEPPLVLADEPTGALDRHTGDEVLSLLAALAREQGRTLIVATHDDAVVSISTRVVRIEDGQLAPERGQGP